MNTTKMPGSGTAISVESEAANYKVNNVTLLGISLSSKPRSLQLLICASAFFFGYTVNGICEEYVYNRLQFSFGWYFTFIQSFIYLGLLASMQGFRAKHMVNPWAAYWKLSAVLMGSHGLTKGSLAYLNYPAQIMFKSTKVLPVMVMGAFIPGLRRKYELHDYFSALLLVSGLIVFTLADAHMSPNFDIVGVLMICGALVLDAFMGNLQEAIFTTNPGTSQVEMLFCSTAAGLPFLLVPMILTGELFRAWTACSQHAYVYIVLAFEAIATFIGQLSVLSLIALFGAATTAMVTTGRKALTLLISYLIFTKPFSEQHVTGLLLIAMGIVWKMMSPDQHRPAAGKMPDPDDDHDDHDFDDDRRRLIDRHITKYSSILPITRSINDASDQRGDDQVVQIIVGSAAAAAAKDNHQLD